MIWHQIDVGHHERDVQQPVFGSGSTESLEAWDRESID